MHFTLEQLFDSCITFSENRLDLFVRVVIDKSESYKIVFMDVESVNFRIVLPKLLI